MPGVSRRRPPIPFTEVARLPPPGMALPEQVAFGYEDRAVTYLYSPEGTLERRLFIMRIAGEPGAREALPAEEVEVPAAARSATFSLAEELRRERLRETGLGVSSATWADKADVLLVPLADGLHVSRGLAAGTGPDWQLVARRDEGEALGPRLSPDGSMVAFSRGGELFVADTDRLAAARQLTGTAQPGLRNGVAEFVAEEEMDRSAGIWWSPDSRLIAYAEVDERHVPLLRIAHLASNEPGPAVEEVHRYPFAGRPNAVVRLGVVAAGGGETVWLCSVGPDDYLARVRWLDGESLVTELIDRAQVSLRVLRQRADGGEAVLLHTETTRPYVRLHDDFRHLSDGSFLWSSEHTGYRHLELRSPNGELKHVLTSGDWQVDRLEGVDEESGLAWFTATKDGPTERHLYEVRLSGGKVRRVSGERGTHLPVVGEGSGLYVDTFSSLSSPPVVTLRLLSDDRPIASLHDRRDHRIDELGLEPPRLVRLAAEDGTDLFGLVYEPEVREEGGGPAPTVVSVYGGPQAQLVVDAWAPTVAMRLQALRRLGCAVVVTDNRGSARRGLAFESTLWRKLGDIEVADQLTGLRAAVAAGLADPSRVAVQGWSYGGYMALRCLARGGGTFRAAVAGAPVTAWDGYDTFYTERYMGTPEEAADAYQKASVLETAADLTGDLLIVHGLVDENVHFRHSARLIQCLIESRRPHDLLLFPEERHLPRKPEDRAFMEERVISWLGARLGFAAYR
jgi:dipeptidyl-peptidase-4